jgi:membrane-bound lytic murein transglycosylase F
VGKRLEVVAQSSYVETLTAARGTVPGLVWTEDPSADAGELLNRVARGEADYTVVDSNLFTIFQRFHPELRVAFDLTEGDAIAWAFQRRGDRSLIDAAAAYLAEMRATGQLAHVMDRYYGHKVTFDYAGTRKFLRDYQQLLPRYREQFMAAAKRADLDWRLIAAVGYQESHWDPAAISPKGAQGIMMLTPSTASLMGVENPANAGQSIVGGSKYLWRMKQRVAKLSPDIPEQDRLWMALAAYNMGYGHLLDARALTKVRRQPGPVGGRQGHTAAAHGAALVHAGPLGIRAGPRNTRVRPQHSQLLRHPHLAGGRPGGLPGAGSARRSAGDGGSGQ